MPGHQGNGVGNVSSHASSHWRHLSPRIPPTDFVPSQRVSVIIPYYMALHNLRLAIAALHNQTYPQRLMEIIVVDDGSEPPLFPGDIPDGIRIIRQERNGYGTARARHAGASAATGSILVFADGDVVLHPDNLREQVRWHTAGSHVFSFGDLLAVDTDLVNVHEPEISAKLINGDESVPHRRLDWHQNIRRWTRDFTRDEDNLFSFIAGYNYAVNRDMYRRWDLGKHSERFRHWGFEDSYVAYRAYAQGAVFVPAHSAKCWHLGMPSYPRDRVQDVKLNAALMEQLVPHPFMRHPVVGRSFEVPECVVTLRTGNADVLLAVVTDLLADPTSDVIIRVNLRDLDADSALYARRRLQATPQVLFDAPGSSLDSFPDSPWHVDITTQAPLKPRLVRRLRRTLASKSVTGTGFRVQGERCSILMARSRYLHQADMGISVSALPSVSAGRFVRRRLKAVPGPMQRMRQYVRRRLLLGHFFRRLTKYDH